MSRRRVLISSPSRCLRRCGCHHCRDQAERLFLEEVAAEDVPEFRRRLAQGEPIEQIELDRWVSADIVKAALDLKAAEDGEVEL